MGIGGYDDGMRTVECLRGRLLAERVASKAAKAEADQMAKRVEELERQVAEELRCRKRAERRMRCALKKLEFWKLSGRSNLSESSPSSSSHSACSSGHRRSVSMKPSTDSEQCGLEEGEVGEMVRLSASGDFVGANGSGDSAADSASTEPSWTSVGTGHSCSEAASWVDQGDRISNAERQIQSSVSSNKPSFMKHQAELRGSQQTSTAASLRSSSGFYKPNSSSKVQDVLLSLRHVREQLQDSVGTGTVVCSRKELCSK